MKTRILIFLLFFCTFFGSKLSAQNFNSVDLTKVTINGFGLYFSTPQMALVALGEPINKQAEQSVDYQSYDGVYPYWGIDPYGAYYGFYPYAGFGWGWSAGPAYYPTGVTTMLIWAYKDMVLYFDQSSPGAGEYLSSANIYSSEWKITVAGKTFAVGESVANLKKVFPVSFQTAEKRHKYAIENKNSYKVIVKGSAGNSNVTEERMRMVLVIGGNATLQAIQIVLN